MLPRRIPRISTLILCLILATPALAFDLGKHFGRGEKGNGTMKTVTFDVADCHAVRLECGLDIDISFGDHQKVALTVDENLVDNYEVVADGGTLVIDARDNPRPGKHAKLALTLTSLSSLAITGAGDVTVAGFAGESLEIDVSGAGDLTLDGHANTLAVDVSGAGDIDARDLEARSVTLTLNGAGDAQVYASEAADVTVNGVGDVEVYGNPAQFTKAVHGVGDIERK